MAACASESGGVHTGKDIERRAAVERSDGIKLPVSEKEAPDSAQVFELWQGIHRVEDKGVPPVKVGVALVKSVIEDIGRLADVRLRRDVAGGGARCTGSHGGSGAERSFHRGRVPA